MRKRTLKDKLVVLATGTALVASTLFTGLGSPIFAETVNEELIQQEESFSVVTLEIPNEAAAKKIRELEIDFDHGIHEHNGVWEVEAVVTPSEVKLLEKLGIKVTETLMTEQVWEKRVDERNRTVQRNAGLAAQEETMQILRANHYTNQSATFLYVEAKSSVGEVAGTVLTARWTENGVEKSATLAKRSDYGAYLYHYLELPITGIPSTVTIVSNKGATGTSNVTEWLGGERPEPGEHYVTGFVDHYMTPAEMNAKMDQLAAEFPELVEIVVMPNKSNGYRRHAQALMGTLTNASVSVTSKAWGHEGGNGVEVSFVNPNAANRTINVIKTDKKIVVQLATDSSGKITSTAKQVVDALNKDASDLVSATTYRGNSGTGVVGALTAKLTDGLKAPAEVSREPMTVRAFRIGKVRDGSKPGVLGYSQEHAREWVTPLVSMESAERLLRNYAHDEETRKLVDNLDIFIVPTVNPDGANYSVYDYNMQRRNMTNHCGPEGSSDYNARNSWGVDLNRNHSIGSLFDGFIGASTSCTSDTFAGPSENSEPEAKNLVWLADQFDNLKFSMNIHSHGGYFMWSPGAYDANRVMLPRPTAGEEAFYWKASEHILKVIQDHRGTVIQPTRTGPIPDVLYSAAGNSADYLWYAKGIYAWNFEVGAPLWNGRSWVSVGFQPVYTEGHEEAMEFANGFIGMLEVALEQAGDKTNPESKAVPGSGRYAKPVEVDIETSEPATVYYTLDGSRPTFDSAKIQLSGIREGAEKLKIDATTTIKYFSVDAARNVENNYDPKGKDNNYNSVTLTIGGDQTKEPGAADLIALVNRFDKEGGFTNTPAVRQLTTHLSALEVYEKQGATEKILKHLGTFKTLLDSQKKTGVISEKAYNSILAYADYLTVK
ncbi:M14 family metallopeptidase [Bacillus sp. OK048]|uniref:M14 family metallopeptidase n=1 Tax=Bacillus sp. OK048 TaxID=1882761 RepID=UPI0008850243|nr:M14 family metallopeptidase [Bacillus sp. OK048]SDM56531.1 Chitobiase/beta-hexosaminidase C-terminal domain-containing protein [Bacillus sp. OK048]